MNKTLKSITSAGFAFLLGMTALTSPAIASTPDGITPANEGICDPLMSATKGLYGLCVAYCEAQDQDVVDRNPPSLKILENYNRKKQDGDPDMPCVHSPCPCWSAEEFAAITIDGQAQYCDRETPSASTIFDNKTDSEVELRSAYSSATGSGRNKCSYIDNNATPIINRLEYLPSQEAADACYGMVNQACDDLGL